MEETFPGNEVEKAMETASFTRDLLTRRIGKRDKWAYVRLFFCQENNIFISISSAKT